MTAAPDRVAEKAAGEKAAEMTGVPATGAPEDVATSGVSTAASPVVDVLMTAVQVVAAMIGEEKAEAVATTTGNPETDAPIADAGTSTE